MNADTPIDDEGVGRLDELMREQRRILAGRETEERRPANVRPSKTRPARRSHPAVRYAAVLVVLAIVGVVAAVQLFQQTVPPSSPGNLVSGCATLTLSAPITPPGTSGFEVLTCGTAAAFSSSTGGSVTPTFTLGTGYTDLGIVGHGLACTGETQLTSGTALNVPAGSYDYCAAYLNAPATGLGTFTITWSL